MGGTPSVTAVPNAFVDRLAKLVPLSPDETAILCELQSNPRTVQRHRDIITEGRNYGSLFIVMEGNAIRYRILHDGRRQIVNIVLPGEILGALGYFMESSLYSTKALTEVVVATIPFARLNVLNETNPRLVTKIFWWFSCESTIYAEHLVDLGRRSALERVAHFLLELLTGCKSSASRTTNRSRFRSRKSSSRTRWTEYPARQSRVATAAGGQFGCHRGPAGDGQGHRSAVGTGRFRPWLSLSLPRRRAACRLEASVAELSQVNFFYHSLPFECPTTLSNRV